MSERSTEEIRRELNTERDKLASSAAELRAELKVAAGKAKKAAAAGGAVVGALGLVRALLKLRRR